MEKGQALTRIEQEEINQEQIYKNSYYRNINSIRKNVQFFFWVTVIPPICYILYFILTGDSFI
jgi:hypothetical protein